MFLVDSLLHIVFICSAAGGSLHVFIREFHSILCVVLSVWLTHGMCLFFLAYWWTRARCHDVALWVSRYSAYWRLVHVFLCLFVLLPWAHLCIFFCWGLHFPLYPLFSMFVEVSQQWMPRMLVHASTAVPFSYGGGILHRYDQFRRSHNTFLVALHTWLELYVPVLINSMVCVFLVLSSQFECRCPLCNGMPWPISLSECL